MPNRNFLIKEVSAEEKYQARRFAMADSIRHNFGEPPDYNNRDDYLKLADKDLIFAARRATGYVAAGSRGVVGFTGSLVFCAGNSLLYGFNTASMASLVTAGLGIGMLVYSERSTRRLKDAISTYIQRLDNA